MAFFRGIIMKTELVISIISISISAISVIIAILSFTSSKAELIFFNSEDTSPLPTINGELYATYKDKKGKTKRIDFPEGLLYHIQVFNPSPKDIAYFGMMLTFNGRPTEAWTRKTLGWATDDPKIILYDPIHGSGEISIPSASYGVFQAHSFTPLYIFMPIDITPIPPTADFQFEYAVRRFPYFGKDRRYSKYKVTLQLKDFGEILKLKRASMKRLTQPMPQSQRPKQTPPYSKQRKHNRRRKHY